MSRLILAAAASALLLLPSAAHAQATVRGVSIGTTCRLTDSRLGSGAPVTLTWDATLKGWKGDGNGLTYSLVCESDYGWFIRAIAEGGNYGLVWQPSTQLRGVSPLTWTGMIPTAGPMWRAYGVTYYGQDRSLAVSITP